MSKDLKSRRGWFIPSCHFRCYRAKVCGDLGDRNVLLAGTRWGIVGGYDLSALYFSCALTYLYHFGGIYVDLHLPDL